MMKIKLSSIKIYDKHDPLILATIILAFVSITMITGIKFQLKICILIIALISIFLRLSYEEKLLNLYEEAIYLYYGYILLGIGIAIAFFIDISGFSLSFLGVSFIKYGNLIRKWR